MAKSFLVQKALTGAQRLGTSYTPRQPITLNRLHALLEALSRSTLLNDYDKVLFGAMFALAFYCFLRVGEFTVRDYTRSQEIIQRADLEFITVSPGIPALQLTLTNFKRNVARTPFHIAVPSNMNSQFCPVGLLRVYSMCRGAKPGPLFCHEDFSPVTRGEFTAQLNALTRSMNWQNVTPHSFRIGAATTASANGISDATIQRWGRWKSDAYKRYIRISQHISTV